MLEGWHEFYTVLGSSAAALVGLLFVTASIGVGYLSAERGSPTRTFTSPIVFHYTYVLFVSLVRARSRQHRSVACHHRRRERGRGPRLFKFHPGPRPAQYHK